MSRKMSVLLLVIALFALALSMMAFQRSRKGNVVETAYERVIRTSTLRCGFYAVPPLTMVDPNTKKMSGMNYLYVERMAEMFGLSVQWSEVLPGQQVEALKTNRVDAICGGEAPIVAHVSTYLNYSAPIVYAPLNIYVRADDTRFEGDSDAAIFAKLNKPDLRAAAMDGDLTLDFASRLFPLVQLHQISNAADYVQLYMDVAQRKADFVICDPVTAQLYMDQNPGKLKRLALSKPVAILPNQFSVLRGQEALADLLTQGVHNMQQRGLDREILDAFDEEFPNAFFRVALPYVPLTSNRK